jgi:hypothetical protein
MRSILRVGSVVAIATFAASGAAQVRQSPEIHVLGYFDASLSDGEHQTGYAVKLWRHKDRSTRPTRNGRRMLLES